MDLLQDFSDPVGGIGAIFHLGLFSVFLGECGDSEGLILEVCALDHDLGLGIWGFRTHIVVCLGKFQRVLYSYLDFFFFFFK